MLVFDGVCNRPSDAIEHSGKSGVYGLIFDQVEAKLRTGNALRPKENMPSVVLVNYHNLLFQPLHRLPSMKLTIVALEPNGIVVLILVLHGVQLWERYQLGLFVGSELNFPLERHRVGFVLIYGLRDVFRLG